MIPFKSTNAQETYNNILDVDIEFDKLQEFKYFSTEFI